MLGNSNYWQFIAILAAIAVHTVSSQPSKKLLMDKPADVCEGFDAGQFLIDFSTMEFVQTDEAEFHISGSVTIRETIDGPIRLTVKVTKSVNGIWIPGLVNAAYNDICNDIEHPSKSTRWAESLKPLLKDGKCPFVKGTHEYDDVEIQSASQYMDNIPRSLLGKWRARVQFEAGRTVLSCNYFYFSFVQS